MKENLFRAELAKNSMSIPELASALGVDKSTIYRWFKHPGMIQLEFIQKTKKLLGISDIDLIQIFFADEVA